MSGVATAAGLVTFPIAATVIGAGVAAVRRPGPKVTSAVQHFAAGVVFAAVAGEVLPDLRNQHSLGPLVAGFVGGVALLLAIDGFARRAEATEGTGVPVPLLVAIAIDLVIDGLLVGLGTALGEGQGRILTLALTLEVLFLGLSLTIQLGARGVRPLKAVAVTSTVSLAIAGDRCRRHRRSRGACRCISRRARRRPGLRRRCPSVPGDRRTTCRGP